MAQQAKYDRREQYEQIVSGLLPGESVIAVYDAVGVGTGFIGLTELQFISADNMNQGENAAKLSREKAENALKELAATW